MADNTPVTNGTGDTIRDKDRAGVKTQIVGLDLGIGGTETLMNGSMPITNLDGSVSAALSATDALGGTPGGAGVPIATAPTAGSFVALAIPAGTSDVNVNIAGTATGTYYFEQSMDSTNGSDGSWIATNFRQTGIVNTVLGYSATAVGFYRGNAAGFSYVRVRNVGGTTPTNTIRIRCSVGEGTTFLNASIPAGSNAIGMTPRSQTGTTPVDISLVSSATSAQLLAANTARRNLMLTNTDANTCYLYYGTTATATKFAVMIPTGSYWEMPEPAWTGRIDVIWAAAGAGRLVGAELS